jgi:cobalt/nickel transport system permease protein
MHISDGVLTPQLLAVGWGIASAGVAVGIRRLSPDTIARTAVFSSAFFLASLVHVSIGPGSAHLSLLALTGFALGWTAFPAIFTALLLQSLLFQFGGLLSLGANTTTMGVGAILASVLFGRIVRDGTTASATIAAFLAGILSTFAGATLVALFIGASDHAFVASAKLLLAAHVPVAVVEGIVTAAAVGFLRRVAPDILGPRRRL